MSKNPVAIVRYEAPLESVRKAVELARGLDHLPSKAKVFIKPNIVFWTRAVAFPKWGVITTSRVVEDVILPHQGLPAENRRHAPSPAPGRYRGRSRIV